MEKLIKACLIFYVFTWVLSGLYFGNAGIINNEYYTQIRNIPKEDFQRIPIDSVAESDSIKYKIFVDRNGNKYSSKGAMEEAEIQEQIKFTWLFKQSETVILILASCFIGALGSCIRIVKELVIDKNSIEITRALLLPIAGFFNGFIVLSISYAIPKYLTTEKNVTLNPASVMVLSLLAGIFIETFMTWLNNLANSLFKNK